MEDGPDVSSFSIAYLLSPNELNNDSTNYWIFTVAGLKRLVDRAGWNVVGFRTIRGYDNVQIRKTTITMSAHSWCWRARCCIVPQTMRWGRDLVNVQVHKLAKAPEF